MKKNWLQFLFGFFLTICAYAQNPQNSPTAKIVILEHRLKVAKQDTAKIRILTDLTIAYTVNEQYENAKKTSEKALYLVNNLIKNKGIKNNPTYFLKCKMLKAKALEKMGAVIYFENSIAALDTLQTALKLWKETNNKAGAASTYSVFGEVYTSKGDLTQSLENYQKSFNLFEEINDEPRMGTVLYSIGLVHRYMLNYGDAMESNVKALQLGRKLKDTLLITEALLGNGFNYMLVGQFKDAIENQEKALKIYLLQKDSIGIATAYNDMGVTDLFASKLDDALKNHSAALAIRKKVDNATNISNSYTYISNTLEKLGNYPEALQNSSEALKYAKLSGDSRYIHGVYLDLGYINMELNDFENAEKNFNLALEYGEKLENRNYQAKAYLGLGKVLLKKEKYNEAIIRFQDAITVAKPSDYKILNLTYKELTETFSKKGDFKKAFESQLKFEQVKDSLQAAEKTEKITKATQGLIFENKRALQKASQEKQLSIQKSEIKRQKLVRNIIIAILLMVVLLAFMFFKRFSEKRKLNFALQNSLNDLKTTQKQLIHSEKMASLGELTAGIAHEIQNPLNFVNNFSEISNELIDEMDTEFKKGDFEEAKLIMADVKQNLKKIHHHGKRADAIVKGMLLHSRKSTAEKEPTDINTLADEYLRLAYHGLRAKDKSFNATLKTDFDDSVGMIKVIPQDIGRVILNLITNAFYAVNERRNEVDKNVSDIDNYMPTVWISTKRKFPILGDKGGIIISVKDNGNGIPKDVLDKIFQPFFTTKPTGQGTGLGLSLSYDIIEAHGGKLKVITNESDVPSNGLESGTEFIIELPN